MGGVCVVCVVVTKRERASKLWRESSLRPKKKQCRVGTTHCQLSKARRNSVEVSGGRVARLLRGHSSRRADGRATCTYRPPIDPPEPRTSLLATTRILVFKLATARVLCFVLLATTSVLSCLPSTLYRLFCSP